MSRPESAAIDGSAGEPDPRPRDVDDVLVDLRAQIEQVDDVAVPDRVALFDRVNATIARELADLDEV